jgi:hypothetical protein
MNDMECWRALYFICHLINGHTNFSLLIDVWQSPTFHRLRWDPRWERETDDEKL